MSKRFTVLSLNYPSFYVRDYNTAIEFYTRVFGPPQNDDPRIKGWKLGDTWLTLFPSEDMGHEPDANPRNAEFAIQVAAPEQVDVLYRALLEAGASTCMEPEDSRMYEPMRFCCVDDPVGIRIDVYCPIPGIDSFSSMIALPVIYEVDGASMLVVRVLCRRVWLRPSFIVRTERRTGD